MRGARKTHRVGARKTHRVGARKTHRVKERVIATIRVPIHI